MGTLGQKLDYLTDTKSILKQKINNLGGSLTDQSTFRSYGDYLDELYNEMPKVTGEGTEITLTPTRKGRMQLALKGNTSQDSYQGYNLVDVSPYQEETKNGVTLTKDSEGNIILNGTATTGTSFFVNLPETKVLTAGTYTKSITKDTNIGTKVTVSIGYGGSAITETSIQPSAGIGTMTFEQDTSYTQLRMYIASGTTLNNFKLNYMILSGEYTLQTIPDYEPYTGGIPSPNPDYPQDIHVVTGNNSVGVTGKNIFSGDTLIQVGGTGTKRNGFYVTTPGTYTVSYSNNNSSRYFSFRVIDNGVYGTYSSINSPYTFTISQNQTAIVYIGDENKTFSQQGFYNVQIELGSTATSYVPYCHADYPINLGSLELCKIGDYQDYLYKENGNWYEYGNISILTSNDFTDNVYWIKPQTSDEYSYFFTPNKDTLIKSGVYNGYCNLFNVLKSQMTVGTVVATDTINFGDSGSSKVRLKIKTSRLSVDSAVGLKEWFRSVDLKCYIILNTPTTTQITDETLIAQLNAIENAMSTTDTTTITQTNSDLPFIITASALKPFTTETLTTSLTDGE